MKRGKWFLAVVLVASAAFLFTHISFTQSGNLAGKIAELFEKESKPADPLLPAPPTVAYPVGPSLACCLLDRFSSCLIPRA